ncbi:MAG: redox-regulated ATPase YchF, partial [Chitinivibrionales bacterium]|nr:redox-regulated ATPase YchF [Chitinivibrionales bacterium]
MVFFAPTLCRAHAFPTGNAPMKIGLIGLPKSGKTTIFNALSKSTAEVAAYDTGKTEPNLATVDVLDERVTRLSEMYRPKKTTYATFELVDFAGVGQGFSKQGADTAVMKLVKTMDALGIVLRNFEDEINGEPSAPDDLGPILDELILTDLVVVENRLERLEKSLKKGAGAADAQKEQKVLLRVQEQLNANRPVRELELSAEEQKTVRGFQLLTAKPVVVVLNSDEARFGESGDVLSAVEAQSMAIVEFSGS